MKNEIIYITRNLSKVCLVAKKCTKLQSKGELNSIFGPIQNICIYHEVFFFNVEKFTENS